MNRRGLRPVLGVLLVIGLLAILRPWTVRPLQSGSAATFDAATYAAQAWPRVLDEASRAAVDVMAARSSVAGQGGGAATAGRRSVFVRAIGTVTEIDRKSRAGVARVRVTDGPAGEVAIAVGPVIRGTALRDATSFIQFNDFANQFEFAAVSRALHERILRDVVGPIDLDTLSGRRVTVIGATTIQAGAPVGTTIEIVPIQIQVEGASR